MALRKHKKIRMRIITGVLTVALIGTGILSSMATVTIARSEEKSEAAVNYLADNTEYVNENRVERMADVLSTMGSKETLEDYYTLAATQIASEDYRSAAESISKCLQLHENQNDALYLDLLMKQGCIYVMLTEYDKALKYLDMALAVDPKSTDAYLIKAQIYSEKGDFASLAASLESYLEINPNDNEIRGLLAQTKFLQASYKEAEAEYTKILQNQNDPQILYLNGLTEIQLGDFINAEKHLTEAIKQNDSYDGIYYYRGVCRMAAENYTDAIADFTASINKNSMTQASYYSRGVCSLMTEKYDYDSVLNDLKTAESGPEAGLTKQAQDLLQKLKDAEGASQAAQDAKEQIETLNEASNKTTDGAVTSKDSGITDGAVTTDSKDSDGAETKADTE